MWNCRDVVKRVIDAARFTHLHSAGDTCAGQGLVYTSFRFKFTSETCQAKQTVSIYNKNTNGDKDEEDYYYCNIHSI